MREREEVEAQYYRELKDKKKEKNARQQFEELLDNR